MMKRSCINRTVFLHGSVLISGRYIMLREPWILKGLSTLSSSFLCMYFILASKPLCKVFRSKFSNILFGLLFCLQKFVRKHAAFHCTISTFSISPLLCGSHTIDPYSEIGLIYVLQH